MLIECDFRIAPTTVIAEENSGLVGVESSGSDCSREAGRGVFNIQNWNAPNTLLVSPNYGKIFGKNNPRRFQFGLRMEF